jgi:integrase
LTLADLIERFLEVKAHRIEATTLQGYRRIADYYVLPRLGNVKVVKLRAVDLDHFYASLLASGGNNGKPLSPRTVRLCHVLIRQALSQARRWGLVAMNQADDASPPRDSHHEITPPSSADVLTLIRSGSEVDPDFGVYLRLLAATGCRRGEALALRWRDLHLGRDTGMVTIARSIALADGGVVEKDTKTHQGRKVTIDAGTVKILKSHRRTWEERASLAGTVITDESFLFSSVLDGSVPWRPDVATNRFGRLCKDVGVKGVRLHDLRHYVATSLGAEGAPIATISSRLGHRNKATTLNIYSHSLPAQDQAAAEIIGKLLDSDGRL